MKSLKKAEQIFMRKIAKSIEKETSVEITDWPPTCAFFLHQPKRPEIKSEN